MTGSGDIASKLPGGDGGTAGSVADTEAGTFAGLIAVLVVATMFITAEFRRGLIRVTLTASPRRGRVLAAKAIVLGAVTFLVGLPAAYIALLTGERKQHAGGISTYPVPALTEARLIVGTAALLAVSAVLALGIGAALRRGAAAVTAVIAVIVLPYFFAGPLSVLPAGAAEWLLRLTPAAGFSISRHTRGTCSSTPAIRPGTGTSRSHRGPASRCCAYRPPSRLAWPGTCCAGGTHLAAIALTVVVSAAVAAAVRCPPGHCAEDPANISLTGIYLGQAVIAIVAVLAVSSEYSTGMIRVTLAAMPRRATMLAARAAVLTGSVLVAGAVAVLGSVLAGRLILPATASAPRTATRTCPWPADRCCGPPSAQCSTSP